MSKFIRKQKVNPKNPTNKTPAANSRLTPNMKIFADQWLIDRNGLQAYKIAYPNIKNDNTAGVCAHETLNNPKVAEYIRRRLEKISAEAEINQEWVLKRYKKLVEYSVDDFFDREGNIKPLNEIPKDKLYAVCGFKANKIISTNKDSEQIEETIIKEFKFPDKKTVLDSLAKYLGMFEKDNEQRRDNTPIQINVALVD
jgi:phage terminase small subunit